MWHLITDTNLRFHLVTWREPQKKMAISLGFLIAVLEWSIRFLALMIVPFRRTPDSARTWLLLILFLPIPGLILYFLIGRARYSRRRRAALRNAAKLFDDAAQEIAHSKACQKPVLPDRFRHAAQLIEKMGTLPPLGGNIVDLLGDYEQVVGSLVQEIERARHHIHLETYIFAADRTGGLIIDALGRAAARGVTCRVLIDAVGSRRWSREVARRLRDCKVEVELTLEVSLWRKGYRRADLRNHRKIAVFDGEIAYIGSQNIIDSEAAKGIVNQELVSRVEGPIVVEAQSVFATDWFLESGETLVGSSYFRHHPTSGSTTAQLLASGPDYGSAGIGLLVDALIHAAGESVVITTPYFIPEEPLLEALRTAVLRGVAVHLIVSQISDSRIVHLAQRSYYSQLLEMGVQVHLHRKHFLHAKHISIDEEIMLIGSSNVDVRSYLLNAEVTLIVYERDVVRDLAWHQQRDMAASEGLDSLAWKARPRSVRFAENIARLLSPLL